MATSGGIVGIFKKIEAHEFTISGISNPDYIISSTYFVINHTLGEVPDFVLIYPKQRLTPPVGTGTNIRVLQFAQYMDIGSSSIANGQNYEMKTCIAERLYTNTSGGQYQQFEYSMSRPIINTLTANTVQLCGNGYSYTNFGLQNGDYIAVIGKIADAYKQGEQVIIDSY